MFQFTEGSKRSSAFLAVEERAKPKAENETDTGGFGPALTWVACGLGVVVALVIVGLLLLVG